MFKVLGLGISFLVGFHAGMNIIQMGGVLAWMGVMLSASSSAVFYTNLMLIGFFLFSFAASVYYLVLGNRITRQFFL
jgi:hypothetical protein